MALVAAAQAATANEPQLLQSLSRATDSHVRVQRSGNSGSARLIGASPAHPITPSLSGSGATPEERRARGFLREFGPLLGVSDAEKNLALRQARRAAGGRRVVKFQQTHQGIPVFGGEVNVQLNAAQQVLCANGKTFPGLNVGAAPAIPAVQASRTALSLIAQLYKTTPAALVVTAPALWIYDPSVWGVRTPEKPALVWRLEVRNGRFIRELVLVDAATGRVALHFNQMPSAEHRLIYDAADSCADPGTLRRSEGDPASGIDEVDTAYLYTGFTYAFYANEHGRDGIDGAGMTETVTVRFRDPDNPDTDFANAYWNGNSMHFGKGYGNGLDVVAHEYTHGVTEHASNLFYYMQSGAINEAFSDIWGEFVQITYETPTAANRWLMGEQVPCGAIRSMKNPPLFNDPDRMGSPLYVGGISDGGGVHSNSGVGNKCCYLLTDGDNFNGYAVVGLGVSKVADLFYECQTNLLTSGSDYQDLADALQQAAINLGYSAADRAEILKAINAVEMDSQSDTAPATEAPLTETGPVQTLFFDDMEAVASGNWASAASLGTNHWSSCTTYAVSGVRSLRGEDPSEDADFSIAMTRDTALPAGTACYLHFKQAYQFANDYLPESMYHGGVVEYSTNGGANWLDADTLFIDNGYNGTVCSAYGNPLSGDSAFVGYGSHGYYSSRADLSRLAGQNVRFRFRIGADNGTRGDLGWFIDDVRVYYVDTAAPGAFAFTSPSGTVETAATTLTLRWSAAPDTTPPVRYKLRIDTQPGITSGLVLDSGWQTETQGAVTFPESGTYYCRLTARDSNGYTRSLADTVIIVVDTSGRQPPRFFQAGATPDSVTNDTRSIVFAVAVVGVSPLDSVILRVSGLGETCAFSQANDSLYQCTIVVAPTVAGGSYSCTITAQDTAGNAADTHVAVTISDSTAVIARLSAFGDTTVTTISGNVVSLAASCTPALSQVLFQYRAVGDVTWRSCTAVTALGANPDTSGPPWGVVWSLAGLAAGDYEVRATATTASGSVDPNAARVRVTLLASGAAFSSSYDAATGILTETSTFAPGAADTRVLYDGAMLSLSAGCVTGGPIAVRFTRYANAPSDAPAPNGTGNLSVPGRGCFRRFERVDGQTTFPATFTLALPYDPSAVSASDLSRLGLYYYSGGWLLAGPACVDTGSNLVRVCADHFSVWATLVGNVAPNLLGVVVYPNPFVPHDGDDATGLPYSPGNASSGIIFTNLPNAVSITVYSLSGRKVASMSSNATGGALRWDACNDADRELASGVYIAVITTPAGEKATRKIMIVR